MEEILVAIKDFFEKVIEAIKDFLGIFTAQPLD